MKVLHIFGAMNRGGAELRTISLMSAMAQRGTQFDYCVLSGDNGVMDEAINKLGGRIHYIKLSWRFIWQFCCMLRREKYDVVHSHVAYVSGFILLLATLAGVKKRVCHFRNTTDGRFSTLRSLRNALLRFLIKKNATHILGVCEGALVGFLGPHWSKNKKCSVVYNGFLTPTLLNVADFWSKVIPEYNDQKIIMNVARMDEQKNHLRQLQIFHQVTFIYPSVHMVFIGLENSKRKATLVSFVERHGIGEKVTFLGLQSDVLTWLEHADVMLFPSLWEGLPGAVIEAASVGVPVVASDLPGVLEIARQLPIVSPLSLAANDEQWAKCVVQQFSYLPPKRERLTQFSRSDFQLRTNIDTLYAIYNE